MSKVDESATRRKLLKIKIDLKKKHLQIIPAKLGKLRAFVPK